MSEDGRRYPPRSRKHVSPTARKMSSAHCRDSVPHEWAFTDGKVLVLLGVSACFAGDVLLGGAGYGASAGLGTGLGVGGYPVGGGFGAGYNQQAGASQGGFSAGASGHTQGSGAFDRGNAYKNVQGYSNQGGHRSNQGFSQSSSNRYGSGFGQGSAGYNRGASGAQGSYGAQGYGHQAGGVGLY
ncbi:hypothetical protein HPB50_017039 [Hyalomma asiaticum]|uniref:Uncharacterized protein n=1 Tax=Hyalomma asiaticum TaxID=266040 RepID=A0ACB7TP01_HYAAI|nr:hypothetical protein HPB50_017039 [Hyalomma asiaticum]